MSLALSLSLRARMEALARVGYPREACGLLLGRRLDARVEVDHVHAARNLGGTSERYELHPADHLAAEEVARSLGLEVVGIWHSHPDRPAVPSAFDRRGAWDRWSYVIVSARAGGTGEMRSWRLAAGRFVEEELRY